MRKLAMAAAVAAMIAASPAVATGGGGDNGRNGNHGPSAASLDGRFGPSFMRLWRPIFAQRFDPPGFSSGGHHFGWFFGRHWGWFKPHNPHFPHEPPASP